MGRDSVAWILRPEVRDAVDELEPGLEGLEAGSRLRRTLDALGIEAGRAAAELYALRERARHKLARADRLLLTRRALEQATDRRVAAVRAARFAAWARANPDATVLDGTAGIGGDAAALADAGVGRLIAADADPDVAGLLAANLALVTGSPRPVRIVCGRAQDVAREADALLLDPDRRAQGPRSGDPEQWSPTWSDVLSMIESVRAACVKLAPATDVNRLDVPAGLPHRWEWVSLGGELKEACLWTGELGGGPERSIVVVEKDGAAHEWSPALEARDAPRALGPEAARSLTILADPDPTLIRSGLLGAFAAERGATPLAGQLAYLSFDDVAAAEACRPFLACYEVLGSAQLDRRRIRALLREHGIGPLTVKKRGHPEDAASLAQRFRGKGSKRGTLVVARLDDGHHAYLVRRLGRQG